MPLANNTSRPNESLKNVWSYVIYSSKHSQHIDTAQASFVEGLMVTLRTGSYAARCSIWEKGRRTAVASALSGEVEVLG